MRCAVYARVSTKEQAVGFSLDGQVDVCSKEIDHRGWNIGLIVKEAASGGEMRKRPELRLVLQKLEAGDLDGLVVSRLDRLSRSTRDIYELMDLAQRQDWTLLILDPLVDLSSPFGRATAGMAAVFAQLEREMISQRQRESVAIRKAAGTYRNPGPTRATRPKTDPVVLRRVAALWNAGMSALVIAETLTEEGYEPLHAEFWKRTNIKYMVHGMRSGRITIDGSQVEILR